MIDLFDKPKLHNKPAINNHREVEMLDYEYARKNYPRIYELQKRICKLDTRLDECFTIEHFHLSVRVFEKIAQIAKENGIKHVYDIGCAYGMAGEIYSKNNLKYHGIEIVKSDNMWDSDKHEYIFGNFLELDLEPEKDSCAVSVLCIGWGCYADTDEALEMQVKKIADNFSQAILYCENNRFFKKYYSKYDIYDVDRDDSLGRIIHLKEKR